MLVEAHDDAELERALAAGADDRRREQPRPRHVRGGPRRAASALAARIPADVVAVAESRDPRAPTTRARIGAAGFDAVLVGEALVRADDPDRAWCATSGPRR